MDDFVDEDEIQDPIPLQEQDQNFINNAPAIAEPAAAFALAPGLVSIDTPIIYGTRVGASLYSVGTLSLPIKFDGEIENVPTFVDGLLARARDMRWTHAQSSKCAVSVIRNGYPLVLNLIEGYGRFTIVEYRVHVMTYYNQATRTAQYSKMMYYCILNTITESANNRVINEQH